MNPPSALHGAMSRDRKPFTYTPGGLDLSEIKSERMAKRLMRNAMNQGVPEVPLQIQSPPMPSTPVALPNYNCLPVQVFPTFNLPANPKALLRTRSNPEPKEPVQRVISPSFTNNESSENNNTYKKMTTVYPQTNNYKSEYNNAQGNTYNLPRTNYGSDGFTPIILPEISYEAEYLCAPPRIIPVPEEENINIKDKVQINDHNVIPINLAISTIPEVSISSNVAPPIIIEKIDDGIGSTQDEQKEVKVVKKLVTKENNVEEQNGDSVEAEMTVQIPTKKSAAKTETKVEVVKKVLPDGSTEEVKTTITKTTIDGRTEIKTKTETTIIPKEQEESEEEVVEEEEEEEEAKEEQKGDRKEIAVESETVSTSLSEPKENGHSEIIKTEEKSEIIATKKVVVVQENPKEDDVNEVQEESNEQDEFEEAEPVTIVLKKQVTPEPIETTEEVEPVEDGKEEEIEEEYESEPEPEVEKKTETKTEVVEKKLNERDEKESVEEEIVEEEEEEEEITKETASSVVDKNNEDEEEEEEEYEDTDEKVTKEEKEDSKPESKEVVDEQVESKEEVEEATETVNKVTVKETEAEEKVETTEPTNVKEAVSEPVVEKLEPEPPKEYKIPIREPSVPMEKVEDVEIKPIGSTPIISKTHTENTEIMTSTIDPSGGLSTQTEYKKTENIVTVNRTTKILDHNYENITQQGIPTVKTYFPPPSIDRISTSPLPSRPYQSQYSEPTTERRHSLLLERLSIERQMPSEIYSQYSTQIQDQSQMDEPQSEVLTVNNVKPSTITNQQWYQQSRQQNTIINNVSSTPTPSSQPWVQPKSQPQPQQQYQPQPQYQSQPQNQYQPPAQPQYQQPIQQQYQSPHQPQYQPPTQQYQPPSSQYQPPVNQYQPPTQPQHQSSYSDHTQNTQSNYSTYTPTPTWPSNVLDKTPTITQPTPYSYLNKDTTDSYQKTTQNYSANYVPPPWEQDSSYTSLNNTHTVYQVPAQTTPFSSLPSQGWKPTPPPAKFSKTPPISYIPPAPNQSFVKPVSNVDPPRQPGRKTYYSEYERRYITVPESTYIPTETKYQPQPDPSPQYYYDNNEPTESSEPQWRRELREFTEKTSQTQTETTSVQPPWEVDTKYVKPPSSNYTSTPTWSQTLRPRSWRERSFESEYVSQEWPKTNTLGRGRPLSTLGKSTESAIPERVRGVSVDRYNPNNYQSPAEHPPVQAHTLTTPAPHSGYHNPNVPAYHTRPSAEPREQSTYQTRVYRESRASPIQSRSFKYLQWITGTDN